MLSPAVDRAASKGGLKMLRRILAPSSIAFLSILISTSAMATAQRTFVASNGNDANPCSLPQPCRTFARAITQTSAGGEVIILDSAGYGVVTITQSVSIIAPAGVYAGISVASGNGITVDGAGIRVTLRGLTINSQGGAIGVHFVHGASLLVEGCRVSGFTTSAIGQEASTGSMTVRDTSITGGSGSAISTLSVAVIDHVSVADVASFGIDVEDGGDVAIRDTTISGTPSVAVYAAAFTTTIRVTLDGVSIAKCGEGVAAFASSGAGGSGSSYIDIVRSRITQCTFDGATSGAIAGGFALIHVTDSLIADNQGAGVSTSDSGQLTASASTIVNNGSYGFNSGGGIFTMSNNQVRDNAPANITGTVTPLLPN